MFDVLLNDSNSILMQNFDSKVTALTLANVSTSQKPEFESEIIKFKKVTCQNSRLPRIGLPSIQIQDCQDTIQYDGEDLLFTFSHI